MTPKLQLDESPFSSLPDGCVEQRAPGAPAPGPG